MSEITEVGDVRRTIESAAEHRALLLDCIVSVAEGRMNVQQANAIVGLSAEVHKSIKAQWDMACFAAETLRLGENNRVLRAGGGDADG